MTTVHNIPGIRKLSEIFKADIDSIVDRTRRERHPLPLPPHSTSHSHDAYPRSYLIDLSNWIQEEAERAPGQASGKMDFAHARRVIREMMTSDPHYDFIRLFPPGYFIG